MIKRCLMFFPLRRTQFWGFIGSGVLLRTHWSHWSSTSRHWVCIDMWEEFLRLETSGKPWQIKMYQVHPSSSFRFVEESIQTRPDFRNCDSRPHGFLNARNDQSIIVNRWGTPHLEPESASRSLLKFSNSERTETQHLHLLSNPGPYFEVTSFHKHVIQ